MVLTFLIFGNGWSYAGTDKDFSKLVAAVKAPGLVEALSGEGPCSPTRKN